MPTTRTRTVKPSGGDYTSLAAWEAGEQANLVSLDEIRQAECYAMEDGGTSFGGWTTDATRYIRIYTPTSERHDGKWNTSKYRIVSASTHALEIPSSGAAKDVRFEGLQIAHAPTGGTGPAAIYFAMSGGDLRVSHCIVRKTSGTSDGIFNWNSSPVRVWNSIIYDFTRNVYLDYEGPIYAYNVTVHSGVGFQRTGSGAFVVKNCLAQDCSDGFNGTFDGASTNNCSDIASDAPGSNPRTGSAVFVDEANDDFHLSASDTLAKDFGTDLSGDATLAFSDDIDGQTRSGTWDIGADEVAAGGASAAPAQGPIALAGQAPVMGRAILMPDEL